MKLSVFLSDGKEQVEKEFSSLPVFEGEKARDLVALCVKIYLLNQRTFSAYFKSRKEVAGSGKKIYRQKGTGRARHSSRGSPIFSGGGVVGKKPTFAVKKINRSMRQLAFKRALFDAISSGSLTLIEALEAKTPKTKPFSSFLGALYANKPVLLVDVRLNDNVLMAARNLQRVDLSDASSLTVWHLVKYDNILMTESGFREILTRVA